MWSAGILCWLSLCRADRPRCHLSPPLSDEESLSEESFPSEEWSEGSDESAVSLYDTIDGCRPKESDAVVKEPIYDDILSRSSESKGGDNSLYVEPAARSCGEYMEVEPGHSSR